MSAVGVSFGTSGTLAASRSAKNRWRSAFDSVETTQSANSSRSRSEPASNGSVSAGFDGVDGGERRAQRPWPSSPAPRAPAAHASSPAARCVGADRRSRASCGSRRPPALRLRERDRARQQIARRRCRSTMPAASALGAGTGLPSVHISSASAAPASRGSRCVPPAPGMMPSSTSGWPTFASFVGDAVVAGHARPRARRRARCRESRRRAAWSRPRCRFSSACVPADRVSESLARLQQLEDLDVGAGDERGARADQHDRVGAGVGDGARDRLVDRFPHARAQRVDRRVVDGDDGDADLSLRSGRDQASAPRRDSIVQIAII